MRFTEHGDSVGASRQKEERRAGTVDRLVVDEPDLEAHAAERRTIRRDRRGLVRLPVPSRDVPRERFPEPALP